MSAAVVLPFLRPDREFDLRRAIADGDPDIDAVEDSLPLADRIAAALEKFQADPPKA